MGKAYGKPLINYEVPFGQFRSLQHISASNNSAHFYSKSLLPDQYQVEATSIQTGEKLNKQWLLGQAYQKPAYLTILTYNVWFEEHNLHIRYPTILKMMHELSADFICLQEVTPKFMKHLLDAVKSQQQCKAYCMPVITMHWYDTIIFSKYPCRFYKKKFANSEMERSSLTAVVEFAQKDTNQSFKVAINCVHLQSSQSPVPRIEQLEEIKALNHGVDLSIIAGDFNFSDGCQENKAIQAYRDVWKTGKRHFSKWASQKMKIQGYTMPATEQSNAVRLDHIIYKSNDKKEVMDEIAIIGDFTVPYYQKDHYSKILNDYTVRTPSDHFGLVAKIIL